MYFPFRLISLSYSLSSFEFYTLSYRRFISSVRSPTFVPNLQARQISIILSFIPQQQSLCQKCQKLIDNHDPKVTSTYHQSLPPRVCRSNPYLEVHTRRSVHLRAQLSSLVNSLPKTHITPLSPSKPQCRNKIITRSSYRIIVIKETAARYYLLSQITIRILLVNSISLCLISTNISNLFLLLHIIQLPLLSVLVQEHGRRPTTRL